MPSFDEVPAQIVGLWMETLFYGIYLVTFFACMKVLLWRSQGARFKRAAEWNKTMLLAALAMFVFGTLDVALGLQHNLEAFWYTRGTAEEEFVRISEWVNVMKFVNYDAQTFIGDGILLYRCFVIYNRSWLVILVPALLWIGTLVFSIFTVDIESTLGTGILNQSQLKPFITGTLALTLAMNVLTTFLMVHRIYVIQQRISPRLSRTSGVDPYSRVIRVLIECGAIYTTSVIILFACYLANSNAQLPVSDSIVQIIGITFNLIIVNVGRKHNTKPASTVSSGFVISMPDRSQAGPDRSTGNVLPLHSITIRTESTITQEPDGAMHGNSKDLDERSSPVSTSDRDQRRFKPSAGWEA